MQWSLGETTALWKARGLVGLGLHEGYGHTASASKAKEHLDL